MNKSRPGVSIITCTNRPTFFNRILANFHRQRYPKKELIIVINHDRMALNVYRKKVAGKPNIKVVKLPAAYSLGACLNYGVRQAKHPIIAKFDDDDYYSPYYLNEQVGAMRGSGAGIVGKNAHLVYLEAKNKIMMTAPGERNKFVGFLAGGTIMFRRRIFRHVRFRNITVGEDFDFLSRCKARGYKLYAASPYNFVGIRRSDKSSHTWQESDDRLLKDGKIVARHGRYRAFATRRFK